MAARQVVAANLRLSVPHITTTHDVIRTEAEYPGFSQFSGLKGAVKVWLLDQLIRRVHVFVAINQDVNENTIENLPALCRGPCRVVTIPNGINVSPFVNPNSEDAMQLRKRLSLSEDVYLMGFIGRVKDQKGFLTLMEAIDRIAATNTPRPFHLAVIGRGDCPRRYRQKMAQMPRLAKYVTFLDPIPNIAATLPKLDLVVMPSLWDACPLVSQG
jgi:glycosyltransferase involved in cell wall biosynthesis